MSKEINVLAMVKGEERYIFLYDDEHRTETLRMLGRYAADPELSFTWYDAAVLSKKIRETAAQIEASQVRATAPLQPDRPGRMVAPRFKLPQ
ncbi:MAG: hypothetical protein ACTHK7_17340 [Aureliella sp.]